MDAKPNHAETHAPDLLAWYDRSGRNLPWRVKGATAEPYRVWLSEIMLQQTTVQAVKDYFERFTVRWPRVEDLAAADDDDVMAEWAGLGYYSRARNLLKAARVVAGEKGGCFPSSEDELRKLPGVGPYTAAAIAAIAFDRPAVVVDGNVERVITRLFAIRTPLPDAKPEVREKAALLTPSRRAGDYAQAMMDLGATICTPKRPACVICPVQGPCAARGEGSPERYPFKKPKPARPLRRGKAFLALRPDNTVLLERRPPKGLLGGMAGVPHSPWSEEDEKAPERYAPFASGWQKAGVARHGFTHFELETEVFVARVRYTDKLSPSAQERALFWQDWAKISEVGFPTVFRKIAAVGAEKLGLPAPRGKGK